MSQNKNKLNNTSGQSIEISFEEEMEIEENLLMPLPNVSELKLKKYVSKRILNKSKNLLKRPYYRKIIKSCHETKIIKKILKKSIEKTQQSPVKIETKLNRTASNVSSSFTSHSSTEIQKNSSNQNIIKAIIYPDEKKLIEQNTKAKSTTSEPISYNKVFAMSVENKKTPVIATIKTRNKTQETAKNSFYQKETPPLFIYKIPQDLLASCDEKIAGTSEKTSIGCLSQNGNHIVHKSFTEKIYDDVKIRKTKIQIEEKNLDENAEQTEKQCEAITRPSENSDLIDLLAEYRAISLYLFRKLNMDPINFNINDDYINLYKLSKK